MCQPKVHCYNSKWLKALTILVVLMLSCHDSIDDPAFELPETPEIPQRFILSETNKETGNVHREMTYRGDYIATRRSGPWLHEFDYSGEELIRERAIYDGERASDTYYTHQALEKEWVNTGSPILRKKVWTSPITYEELTINVRNGANTVTEWTRYLLKDHKPISSSTYRMVNGEEKEVMTAMYYYDKKVLNPYFGRYGKDAFQPLWLHTRYEEHTQFPNGQLFLLHESEYDYEVDEDLFPLSSTVYFRDHDVPSWTTNIIYQYR